jgi:hypothetical protein
VRSIDELRTFQIGSLAANAPLRPSPMMLSVSLPSYSPDQAQGSAQDFMAEPGASIRFRQHHSVTRKDKQSLGVHAQISLYIDKK